MLLLSYLLRLCPGGSRENKMKRLTLVWLILCLLLTATLIQACGSKEGEKDHAKALMTITVVYDNYEYDPRLTTAWGFA